MNELSKYITDQKPERHYTSEDAFYYELEYPRPGFTSDIRFFDYTRQQVLREGWIPNSLFFFVITPKNEITPSSFGHDKYTFEQLIFAPTLGLAEEIVQIREGKWLPKKNDYACGYSSKTGTHSSWHLCDMEHDFTEERRDGATNHYFPTAKQRDTFIAKHKKEEPKIDVHEMRRKVRLWFNGELGVSLDNERIKKIYEVIYTDLKREPEGCTNKAITVCHACYHCIGSDGRCYDANCRRYCESTQTKLTISIGDKEFIVDKHGYLKLKS